jgi:hypothetical protein
MRPNKSRKEYKHALEINTRKMINERRWGIEARVLQARKATHNVSKIQYKGKDLE